MKNILGGGGSSIIPKVSYCENEEEVHYSYDAEIEYLEGNGTQWIDTKISFYEQTDIDVYINFVPTSLYNYVYLWSDINSKARTENFIYSDGRITQRISAINDSTLSKVISKIKINENQRYECVSSLHNKTLYININNSIDSNANVVITPVPTSNSDICIGRGSTSVRAKIKIYSFYIMFNNNKVFDCIPVRIGQVGYMYDKVSGKLFGNNGTGNFILGPDK